MNPTSAGMGPAARAVITTHEAAMARYRRWTFATRAITIALIVAAVLPFVAMVVVVSGLGTPTLLNFVPVGLLVSWLLRKDEILTLLGRPGYPQFPATTLALAQDSDARAANPQPFGSLPPGPRFPPRNW
ncbi:hypothetical protein SAMN05216410_1417 [Sanguibacter gelidistatuariae]|uniref:Uncharacterized protein n=1 Tax=Sanguibacter gelidistatuariae TaxID=1814289 RepID=A0A1G6JU88_9MICO|nr:hypothetical protein [Sanguibacter gelidistatuariae]SDC22267.1 hypothetical protein SAMN05216410_1417 [Sanguibacter gelidistatuariae]